MTSKSETEPGENLIQFHHDESTDGVWETIVEDTLLETSTPKYKRGLYEEVDPDEKMHKLILSEGLKYTIPKWMHRACPPSVCILVDYHLKEWPFGDTVCRTSYMEHLPLSQWIEKIKKKTIVLNNIRIIVLYLQKDRYAGHFTPMKNRVVQICRTI